MCFGVSLCGIECVRLQNLRRQDRSTRLFHGVGSNLAIIRMQNRVGALAHMTDCVFGKYLSIKFAPMGHGLFLLCLLLVNN